MELTVCGRLKFLYHTYSVLKRVIDFMNAHTIIRVRIRRSGVMNSILKSFNQLGHYKSELSSMLKLELTM
jgi:hypothetical protein